MKIAQQEVTLIDSMGTDLSVVNAARVSFDKESDWDVDYDINDRGQHISTFLLSLKDQKLIEYLAKHNHWSPFSHVTASFRVKAPIFVARQLAKHQVGFSWNEVSRRYVDTEPEFFVPSYWRKKAENVKQGSSSENFGDVVLTGKCLYCGEPLTGKRTKYCSDNHQAYHWQQKNPFMVKFSRWKASAKASGIPFEITEDDLGWPKHCPYLDIELNYSSDDRADSVASLDKIIPEKGYVKGNVQIISQLANKMKSSASKEQLLTFAKNAAIIHGGVFTGISTSYEEHLEECVNIYNKLIADGLCAEQARMFMPQSMMVEWIWTGSLYGWARMCKLRLDSHTQKETQEIAEMISNELKELFPVSWEVLMEY